MDRCSSGREGGVILVVVMILAVTFGVLSMALLSTAEMSLRVQSNGQDIERAERAAQSAVEWAAAGVKASGLVAGSRSTVLGNGVTLRAAVRTATTPHLLGEGASHGIAVTVGADVVVSSGAFPHALLSFAESSTITEQLTIVGSAYFGAPNAPLQLSVARPLRMFGDLDLVASTTSEAGSIEHKAGKTNLGVTALTEPPWNTLRFAIASFWTVPHTVYNGSTTITGQDLEGIVVVNLGAGQTLTIEDSTLRGTLVVPWVYPPVLEFLGVPTLELGKNVTIEGGTAESGNLAILAPGCVLQCAKNASPVIDGVTYVRETTALDTATFRGQLLVRKQLDSRGSGAFLVERAVDFVPTVPHGIVWGGNTSVRLDWKGKQ